jgi:5-hydroxyisourate hydrolase
MTLSTHVLDTSAGRPASAVNVALQRQEAGTWVDLSRDVTNADGRATGLAPAGHALHAGTYRLAFGVGEYFARRGVESFYGTVTIEFIVRDAGAHYHVPLLVSPYGYSTYRGN